MTDIALWTIVVVGHLGIAAVIFNQTHATTWPRPARKSSEKVILVVAATLILWFVWQAFRTGGSFDAVVSASLLHRVYLWACLVLGVLLCLRWVWRKWRFRLPGRVKRTRTDRFNVARMIDGPVYQGTFGKLLGSIPFNQAHTFAVEHLEICPPRLEPSLDGIRICHLSDLHFTGQICKGYFQQLVDTANGLEPDLVFITGDLIDEHECLDWIEDVFGQLNARCGVYYVLGNHDKRIRAEQMLRDRLAAAGLIPVAGPAAGTWVPIEINGSRIMLAGSELPWYRGAETLKPLSLQPSDSSEPLKENGGAGEGPLKICLSHSPDQHVWAQQHDFDLMFAGHTHGGQIQLPVVGPVVAPSRFGVLFASGTFELGKMIMHVSRGISGDTCIRINCAPEVGCITLNAPKVG